MAKSAKKQEVSKTTNANDKWLAAQKAEREQHKFGYVDGILHYAESYTNYFHFVGLGKDLQGLSIIEVGPADFPALNYCKNWAQAWVVEPMISSTLGKICKERGIGVVLLPFEDLPDDNFTPSKGNSLTEVWLFNVLQHVADPEAFIKKAKVIADRIRFFEPINQPVTTYHLHEFSIQDYQSWFGECVQLYAGGSVKGFHEADCAYGVWVK